MAIKVATSSQALLFFSTELELARGNKAQKLDWGAAADGYGPRSLKGDAVGLSGPPRGPSWAG